MVLGSRLNQVNLRQEPEVSRRFRREGGKKESLGQGREQVGSKEDRSRREERLQWEIFRESEFSHREESTLSQKRATKRTIGEEEEEGEDGQGAGERQEKGSCEIYRTLQQDTDEKDS